jgi:hypothetical protein
MNNNTSEQWVFVNNIPTLSSVNGENGDAPSTQTVRGRGRPNGRLKKGHLFSKNMPSFAIGTIKK